MEEERHFSSGPFVAKLCLSSLDALERLVVAGNRDSALQVLRRLRLIAKKAVEMEANNPR